MDDLERLRTATEHLDAPFALVDLDAFRANATDMVRRAGGKPIRVASKSVRCRSLLSDVLSRDGYQGVLSFTLPEALWLHAHGFQDLLVAYPTADRGALARLAADEDAAAAVAIMVDDPAQLDLVPDGAAPVRVCIDIDA